MARPQMPPEFNRGWGLRQIAETTLEKIVDGAYFLDDVSHDLSASVRNLERYTKGGSGLEAVIST